MLISFAAPPNGLCGRLCWFCGSDRKLKLVSKVLSCAALAWMGIWVPYGRASTCPDHNESHLAAMKDSSPRARENESVIPGHDQRRRYFAVLRDITARSAQYGFTPSGVAFGSDLLDSIDFQRYTGFPKIVFKRIASKASVFLNSSTVGSDSGRTSDPEGVHLSPFVNVRSCSRRREISYAQPRCACRSRYFS